MELLGTLLLLQTYYLFGLFGHKILMSELCQVLRQRNSNQELFILSYAYALVNNRVIKLCKPDKYRYFLNKLKEKPKTAESLSPC